ncbi:MULTISPECIES: prephenate dehydratase [Anaeromyxobacter]|uniref:prephenate dehydratase n=1 Tax=Anaeromyxobacter TaxID=161492 RepID=UPI001F571025|nr:MULTISPECIES: prephenate dehydratase [unclassified Anaeromyxobacter]
MRIAYLGPPGTFSEEAVSRCDLVRGGEAIPRPTFADAYHALRRGEVDGALLPIENSIEGSVGATLDLLVHEPGPLIRRELLLPVRQHLLARPGTRLEEVRRVLSHPQPFGQCSRFLGERLPGVTLEPTHSTAEAARKVGAGEAGAGAAAIGSRAAAARYGLELLAESIQDVDENFTRFVLLAQADEAPTGADRTSIAFTLDRDRPGGLYEVLGELASRGINLSKVESRPMKQALGHYVFFLDFEAHRLDAAGAEALAGVRARVHRLWLLGSYPRGGTP